MNIRSTDILDLGPPLIGAGGEAAIICTYAQPIRGTTAVLVYGERCLLVGVILRAGAAETILRVFDSKDPQTRSPQDERPGVRTATFNGYVGQTMVMEKGLVAILDVSDANTIGWALYSPLR